MKKILFICTFGVLIFSSNAAFATLKIGIVDMQQLIKQDPMVQTWRSKIANKFKSQNGKMVTLRNSLLKNINKLKTQPSNNVITRRGLRAKIRGQAKRLRALQVALKDNLLSEQRKAIAVITQKIRVAIDEVASREKINLVLNRSSICYCCGKTHANPGINITSAVNKILHRR